MSVQTRPPGGNVPQRPADRLPRSATPVNRGREIRLGVLGVLGLVVLVVGIPVCLILFVGYPLPRSAPSKDWLTTSISATLIIKALACIVWLVWAHFVVCLLTEWRAVRRGRVPSHVALGGGSQLLARRLVAAALLLAGAASAFSQSGVGPSARPPAAVASQQAGASTLSSQSQVTPTPAREPSAEATTQAEVKYYTVQPPHGRRYDSLWDIADRTLNDPLRYKEIFALNRDRIQSDGRKLIDANLIMPGWQLRLPHDASGPGVHSSPAAKPTAQPGRGEGHRPSAGHGTDTVGSGLGGLLGRGAQSDGWGATTATIASGSHAHLPYTVFGGGLVLAGLLTALTARRGPYSPVDADEDALAGADPQLADVLDRALRHLARARTEQRRPLPHPVVAWASHERIVLNFSGGDLAAPPAPWRARADGRSWELAASELPDGPAPDFAAPFPGLLSVGQSDGFELFLDVEHAPGVISIAGDLGRGRELALALAVQAATCQWSDGAKVTAVGFGGENLVQIAPRSIAQVPRLSDVLPKLEQEHAEVKALQRELGVDGVLTGRQVHRSGAWQPRLVLLSGLPTPDEAHRLQALSYGRSTTAVVVVGDVAGAPWRFVIDGEGQLDLGSLGVSATAHRLSHEAAAQLVAMLVRADADRLRHSREVSALRPAAAVADTPRRASARHVPVAAAVTLLGPVDVSAVGPLDPQRRALATEIVVAAALHPNGLHDAVLRASVWPRGVGEDVFTAALSGVQAWLGTDHAGKRCLVQSEDGAWRLSEAVRVDWTELQALAASAGGDQEAHALAKAVALFAGEAFSDTPAGRYGWLGFARAAREARVLGTAVARRAAALQIEAQRTADAVQTLRRGLVLVPTAEPLWRDLLTLSSWDGTDGAAAVATEMYAVLRAHRIWPEPETDALIAELAPGYDPDGPLPSAPAVAAG